MKTLILVALACAALSGHAELPEDFYVGKPEDFNWEAAPGLTMEKDFPETVKFCSDHYFGMPDEKLRNEAILICLNKNGFRNSRKK